MILYLDVRTGTDVISIDFYAALEIDGSFYFLPNYTGNPHILYSGILPANLTIVDIPLVIIPFTTLLPELTGTWHAAVLHMDTVELLDYDAETFLLY